jgi:hypothetical protein
VRIAEIALIAGIVLALTPADPVCARLPSGDARHSSGLAIAPGHDPCYFRSQYEPVKAAFGLAHLLAEANPDDLGYPWDDRANRELVLRVATPRGQELAAQWIGAAPRMPVAFRIQTVTRSFGELERIKHDAIEIARSKIRGAEYIGMTAPDYARNRVLIGTTQLTDEVAAAIVAHYGTEAVAVLIGPQYGPFGLPSRLRH